MPWPFITYRRQKAPIPQEQLEALQAENKAVLRRLADLQEQLDATAAALERLRGRFYATGAHKQPPAPQSKADILREFGYMPGKPAPHT